MITARYQQLATRVDTLQLRERVLLLIACLVVLFFLVDSFGLQPVFRQQQELQQNITDQEMQLEVLRTRTGQLGGAAGNDPAMQLGRLQAQLDELGLQLQSRLGGMLAPDQAASILEQVLAQEAGLTLQAVNASSEPLMATATDTGESVPVAGIGRYELELQLEGGYLSTLNYLRALEALPWNFFWKGVTFEITEYPKARITIDIYTLGLLEG
ncbi:MAG: hypothetical protein WBQ78_17505 [Gammaproteobacteria bacterium]